MISKKLKNLYFSDTKSGAVTKATVDKSLITQCKEGPTVSLKGSPTVSPVTDALCASLPFPPYLCSPVSTSFFALSHAPPALFRKRLINSPLTVENTSTDRTACAPNVSDPRAAPIHRKMTPMTTGKRTASVPGLTIIQSAALATMETQAL